MAVTLIATPKDTAANSYTTEVDGTAFLTNTRPSAEMAAWNALSADDRSRYLIMATRILDQCMKWEGVPRTLSQSLQWPRVGVRCKADLQYYDLDTIPGILAEATAEFALSLSQRDRIKEPAIFGRGLGVLYVGDIRMHVDHDAVLPLIPAYVLNMLRFLGSVDEISAAESGGDKVMPLLRA